MKIVKPSSLEKVTRYIILILIFVVFGIASIAVGRHDVKASSFSWMSGDIHVNQGNDISSRSSDYKRYGDCNGETIERAGYFSAYNGACVFQAKSYRYTIIDGTLYISVGSDKKFYAATGSGFASWNYVVPSPETNDFIFNSVIWRDLLSHLTFVNSGTPHYEVNVPYENITTDNQGNGHSINTVTVSRNGRWAMVYVQNLGFVRVDLVDMSVTWIAPMLVTGSNAFTAISNDGKYVAIAPFSPYEWPIIYTIDNCGQSASRLQSGWFGSTLSNPCQSRNLHSLISTAIGGPFTVGYWPDFSDDGGQLKMLLQLNNGEKGVLLSAAGYNFQTPRLDYLALGDSYSSGEGDATYIPTSQKKWYREYTDNEEDKNKNVPREKCHISTRSYPYLTAWSLGLGYPSSAQNTKWQTVACSGATTWDIAHGNNNGYEGQGKGAASIWPWDNGSIPRLQGFMNIVGLKDAALTKFIPGRNEQIEFVKNYRPKIITLTAGGNDVGFGDKVAACITKNDQCKHVSQQGRKDVGVEIQNHLGTLVKLYKDMKAASPSSKIYVLNYPQFINGDENANCNSSAIWNTGPETRRLFKEGYSYMNKVIERAAQIAGVYYVDIEDVLQGHLLCDGTAEKYVTGFVHRGGLERQETFHPNSQGHRAISQRLLQKLYATDGQSGNPLEGSNNTPAPALPGYLNPPGTIDRNIKTQRIVSEKMEKGGTYNVSTSEYTFKANSMVTNTAYSDPIDLGIVNAESDGSLSAQVMIPNNIPAGYHTLVVTGESYSGEPVAIQQTIEIQGTDPDDRDENGISDNKQPCGLYITSSGIDVNLNGIDDACDPEISASPQLYRLRQGDPTRTYAGQPEKAHYLYIERNTRASSLTGITGDYDPDGDGWAIVGASQGKDYTATSIPDTAPAANFTITGDGTQNNPYTPTLSLRAGGWGCVQYKPTSLSKVTASQFRTLTRTATNTNTCRQEPPEDDVDGNGKPDNTQPLYIARNGDSAKGEDSGRLYLYRSFHAAESQLGFSDYTPTGTTANTIAALPLIPTITTPPNDPIFGRSQEPIQEWNLLATTKAGEPIPQFNKLVIIDDNGTPSPVILTKNQNNQCIAYKPQNVGIIKFNQQNSLVKLTNTPQGAACE